MKPGDTFRILHGTDSRPRKVSTADCTLSVVVPVRDEAPNIAPLLHEIQDALSDVDRLEVIFVDDGSVDRTRAELAHALGDYPWLRCFVHDRWCGQSAALRTGVRHARAAIVATLDGDGQNDPADIPRLLSAFLAMSASNRVGMVAGQRLKRCDTVTRRLSSFVANGVRRRALGDDSEDTGCG